MKNKRIDKKKEVVKDEFESKLLDLARVTKVTVFLKQLKKQQK
ncbi:MAG: hypothetical protein XE08_0400 [Parcubacteria bacterium 32_520]|nr:MAG: hypothetical protein XE08_0400 [Parcubacteria bacterium 32_520]